MKQANTNPMGARTDTGVDYGAVRLARKKANINRNTTTGTNTAPTGVSLSRPKAKGPAAMQPANSSYKSQPSAPKRGKKLNRRARTK